MTRSSLLFGLLVLCAVPAPSADPMTPPDARTRAEELVRALGSPAFADRDRATRELRKLGRLALPALLAARRDDNPEVRMRAAWLLPTAESDAVRVRLEAFLADEGGTGTHDLPGWPQFRRVAGCDRSARELFAEAVRDPLSRTLLAALGGVSADAAEGLAAAVGGLAAAGPEQASPSLIGRAVVARRLQMYGQYGPQQVRGGAVEPPDLSALAALLLAESLTTERAAPQTGTQFYTIGLFDQRAAGEAVSGSGRFGPAFRRLAVYWLDTRDAPSSVMNAFRLGTRLRLPAATQARYAARVCSFPGLSWLERLSAITALGQSRETQYLPTLAKNFTDQSALPRRGGAGEAIQVRDIALAAAVRMTGQDPAEYGFTHGAGVMSGRFGEWGFSGDVDEVQVKRATAFEQWRAWEASVYGAVGGPAGGYAAADAVWVYKKPPTP